MNIIAKTSIIVGFSLASERSAQLDKEVISKFSNNLSFRINYRMPHNAIAKDLKSDFKLILISELFNIFIT